MRVSGDTELQPCSSSGPSSCLLSWPCSWYHHCQPWALPQSSCFLAAQWEQMSQSLLPSVPMAWPAEELPRKEQVVPFTVSPQLLHSPFLHSTGKRSGRCGNVLAQQSQAGRSA